MTHHDSDHDKERESRGETAPGDLRPDERTGPPGNPPIDPDVRKVKEEEYEKAGGSG